MSHTSQTANPEHRGQPGGREGADGGVFASELVPPRSRWVLIVLGIVCLIAGIVALAMPFLASITAAVLLGWVLVASGAVGLFTAFRRSDGWRMASAFALALISLVAGILIVIQPVTGILAITSLVVAYFAISGVLRIYYGVRNLGDGGGWMLAIGVLSLILAVMLFFGYPFNAAWVPGVLLGLDLVILGAMQVVFGLREGRATQRV